MRSRIANLWRWALQRVPEALLLVFALSLAPLVALAVLEVYGQATRFLASPAGYYEATRHDPWPALATAAAFLGTGVAAFILWRNWLHMWAVARKMILEALHRKIVLVLLIFFVVLTASLPFLKTEGSIKSRVQLVMSYSLVLAMVLLSLVAIFLSVASICSEIEHKQVHVTDTKPLRRWQFLLGKWFGVVVLCSAVLFVMAGACYGLVVALARPPDEARMDPRDVAKARQDYASLMEEVLVARRTVRSLVPPGIEEAVQERVKELEAQGKYPWEPGIRSRVRKGLADAELAARTAVPPGGMQVWKFEGLRPGREGQCFVRFKAYGSTFEGSVAGRWIILQQQRVEASRGESQYPLVPVAVVVPPPTGWQTQVRREFTIPTRFVQPEGTLFLAFENLDQRATLTFDPEVRVEVMQKEQAFLPNYYRAVVVLLCHIALLAALGLMAGSLFSFPVAAFTVVFIFIVGLVGVWFASFLEPHALEEMNYTLTQQVLRMVWRGFVGGLLALMPHFGKYNPLGDLTDGKMVTWTSVAYAWAVMVCIKGGLALLVGMFVYARRELARVIV
jgi:hypothetical protein